MQDTYLQTISLDDITPDPEQPRVLPPLDDILEQAKAGNKRHQTILSKLQELATSILDAGLQQPITVYTSPDGDGFMIYDGHRRWLAMTLLNRQTGEHGAILCRVRPIPAKSEDRQLGQIAVNLQRDELNVFELARSLKRMHAQIKRDGASVRVVREEGGIEVVELPAKALNSEIWELIQKKIGISKPRRYQIQAVLKLPEEAQQIAEAANISENKLRLVIPVKNPEQQLDLIKEIAEKELSPADIRKQIKALHSKAKHEPQVTKVPTPVQIRSALKPIHQVSTQLFEVIDIEAAISSKDPRTVAKYQSALIELRAIASNIDGMIQKLSFVE